jgi:hypothetical protein
MAEFFSNVSYSRHVTVKRMWLKFGGGDLFEMGTSTQIAENESGSEVLFYSRNSLAKLVNTVSPKREGDVLQVVAEYEFAAVVRNITSEQTKFKFLSRFASMNFFHS